MSDRYEVDTDELVEQLGEHQRLTGTEPQEGPAGMTRRDLLLKGRCRGGGVGRRRARRHRSGEDRRRVASSPERCG